MASTSNSEFEYDIFLSFCGEDTRKKFADHLFKALNDEGFHTFRDDEEIPMGEFIKPQLEKAIMNSRMSVLVLSKNYAKSTACLFELQLILERRKTQDHFVLPVFYEVDPEEIKKQAEKLDFGEKVVTVEKLKGWSKALKDVARMKGPVSQNQCDRYETKFIEDIVGKLKSKLTSARPRVADPLVSIDSRRQIKRNTSKDVNGGEIPQGCLTSSPHFRCDENRMQEHRLAKQLTPIKNINGSTRNWTAKVKVLEKWRPRTAQHSPLKFQNLILADAEGTRVQATIFAENIEKLKDTLEVYNTYLISNAEVQFVPAKYRTIDFEWQWKINASTLIQTFDESLSHQDLLNLDFVPFEQFEQHVGEQTSIDVLAVVAHVQTPKVLNKPGNPRAQEIIVINQEMKPIILTFWDDFLTREGTQLLQNTNPSPVLIGIQVKVTPYNGHSLSSRAGSSFVINPDTGAAYTLKAWCDANNEIVQQLCNDFLAKPIIRTVPDPKDNDIIPINDVPKTPETVESDMYWIRGKISIVSTDQDFWYMSCSNCRKSISARDETIFNCFNCNTKKVMTKPRVKFEVLLTDGSGSMTATMFENHAKEYFLVDGNTLMKYAAEKAENVIAVFPKLALENEYRIQLKPREYPSRSVEVVAYNINTIKPTLREDKANDDPLCD